MKTSLNTDNDLLAEARRLTGIEENTALVHAGLRALCASPSEALYDYQTKRELYVANGVPEYWVLNDETRNLSRWRGAADPGDLLSARVEWHPPGMPEPLVLDVPRFFDEAVT